MQGHKAPAPVLDKLNPEDLQGVIYFESFQWGRPGFDVGCETWGACRGTDYLV